MENPSEEGTYQDLTVVMAPRHERISHRKLSPTEARAIWAILNPASPRNAIHELRLVLKPEHVNGARGWMMCTE